MKLLWKIFAVLALAVAGGVLWLCQKAGGLPLSALFLDSFLVTQMAVTFLVLVLILALILTFLPNGRGQANGLLMLTLWVALGFSILATAYGLLNIRVAMERTHTTNLQIIAPSLAESLVPLALGLLIAAIAAAKAASARKPSPAANFD